MTIRELLNLATKKLQIKSTSPELDAEVLLAHVLKKSRVDIFVRTDTFVQSSVQQKFLKLIKKRQAGWPVAYLTGHKEFFGLDFLVTKDVLIPRPETEGLVELVLEKVKSKKSKVKILDIGTGSGNIIISLATSLNSQVFKDEFYASDISSKALVVAKRNAKRHKTRILFKQSDILEGWRKQHFDIIVANLPYLARQTDPSTKLEPKNALVAKKQGLALIEKLFHQVSTLKPHPSTLFLEIGHDQGPKIKNLARKILPASPAGGPGYETKIFKDLSGWARFAVLVQKPS